MFSAPKKNSEPDTIDTVIGISTIIDGNINSKGVIRIDGQCEGNVNTDRDLTIGETGCVNGDVNVSNLCLAGKIKGNVNCKGYLQILSSGELTGDVEVESISVDKGAIFKGKMSMLKENPPEYEVNETTLEE